MSNTLKIFEIILAIVLTVLILLQQRGSGLGAAFGGDGNVYRSRRGIEKVLFNATIVTAILFCLTAVLAVFIS